MVKQPPRRGNQHIDTPVDQLVLFTKGNATDQQRLGQLRMFCIGVKVFRHLRRQFPRRAQHQRTRHPGAGTALTQQRDHRQAETGGLAGSGLGDAQNILALQGVRNRLFLNGCRGFIAGFGHSLQNARVEREVGEFGHKRPVWCGTLPHGIDGTQVSGRPGVIAALAAAVPLGDFCGKVKKMGQNLGHMTKIQAGVVTRLADSAASRLGTSGQTANRWRIDGSAKPCVTIWSIRVTKGCQ